MAKTLRVLSSVGCTGRIRLVARKAMSTDEDVWLDTGFCAEARAGGAGVGILLLGIGARGELVGWRTGTSRQGIHPTGS